MAQYVNNKDLYAAMVIYITACKLAKESGLSRPQVPNYIGECILKIATHLSYKPNFSNYTYKDDMILDGIENCILYIHNFDPDKYSNPFSYFTQIVFFAFIRRISKEKKHSYIKNKLIQNMVFDLYEIQEHDDSEHFQNAHIDFMKNNQHFDDYLVKKEKKVKKSKVPTLDEFIEENEDIKYGSN